MVTKTQKGMMYYHMQTRLIKLVEYFTNITKGGYDKVVKFVNDACAESGELKALKQTSDEISLVQSIPVIKRELSGMFRPDMKTLNKLAIINSTRKEMVVNVETFELMSGDLRNCAIFTLRLAIKKYSELSNRETDFHVLCEQSKTLKL